MKRLPLLILLGWLVATMGFWLFAFFRMPEATPAWLLRAQAVCFGSTETGLPDTYGWMILIMSPLLFLAAFGAAYGRDLARGLGALYRSPLGKAAILLVVLAVSSEAAWVRGQLGKGRALENARYLAETPSALPDQYPRLAEPAFAFSLTDQLGQRSGPADFLGTPLILTFAFSRCATVCPAILNELKKASADLDHRIPILVVTLDPWRDRPSQLETVAKVWELGPKARLYSGEVPEVLDVLQRYRVPISRDEKTGDVTHPPMVYVLDAAGRLAYAFNMPSASWITGAVARIGF